MRFVEFRLQSIVAIVLRRVIKCCHLSECLYLALFSLVSAKRLTQWPSREPKTNDQQFSSSLLMGLLKHIFTHACNQILFCSFKTVDD